MKDLVDLPKMDKVIGHTEFVDKIAGGFAGSLREDGNIQVEVQAITDATSEVGFAHLTARTF